MPHENSKDEPVPAGLDVGVIYTGERHFMAPLLTSITSSTAGLPIRLILVDNASPDGIDQWRLHALPVTVVSNARRQGYAANLNRVLNAAVAPYVLLLNTDVYFDPEEACLAKMVRFMDANPDCGISICRVYHPDGSYAYPARRYQTLAAIAARRLGLSKLLPGTLDHYLYRQHDPLGSFTCDWISGCFMCVRLQAVTDVGGFDCRFRKYYEDVDICARIRKAGWEVLFNGATYCYHHEQRHSSRLFSADAYRHLRSYCRWLWKWGFRPPRPMPGALR